MNTDLLFKLYSIYSKSGNEKKMRKFIKQYIWKNCGSVKIVQDDNGNLLCTKGESDTYPCLASHIDQVQDKHSKDFTVAVAGDDVIGWSHKSMEQQGLGADDKNGIFICLELLKRFDVMKVAFFVGEEVGCIGSNAVDLKFFKDCRFIVEPDRRGGSDLITTMSVGKVCSDEFITDMGYEEFGYTPERGSITDVGELVERGVGISCLNLSCGYYHAHTDRETTVLSELENCMNFVANIVEKCTKVYPFVYERSYSGYGYNHNYGNGYGKSYGSSKKADTNGTKSMLGVDSNLKRRYNDAYFDSYEDCETYYLESGSYDKDKEIIREYLLIDANLSLDYLIANCEHDFYVYYIFYDDDIASSILEDIYTEVREELLNEQDDDTMPFDSKDEEGDSVLQDAANKQKSISDKILSILGVSKKAS